MGMKRAARPSFMEHLFSTVSPGRQNIKANVFFVKGGVCIPLRSLSFCKDMWGIWGFDKALKETSKLSGISLSTSHCGTEGI